MKSKILGIVVPALSVLAIVGTGFATWHFSNEDASLNANVELAGYTNTGKITITNQNAATLNLDASNSDTSDSGIHLTYSNNTGSGAGGSGRVRDRVETLEENTGDNKDKVVFSLEVSRDSTDTPWPVLQLKTTIAMATGVGSYVQLSATNTAQNGTVSTATTGANTLDETSTNMSSPLTKEETITICSDCTSATTCIVTVTTALNFSWASCSGSKEPSNTSEWSALQSAISSATATTDSSSASTASTLTEEQGSVPAGKILAITYQVTPVDASTQTGGSGGN